MALLLSFEQRAGRERPVLLIPRKLLNPQGGCAFGLGIIGVVNQEIGVVFHVHGIVPGATPASRAAIYQRSPTFRQARALAIHIRSRYVLCPPDLDLIGAQRSPAA